MFCSKCGAKNANDTLFCGECGVPLGAAWSSSQNPQQQSPKRRKGKRLLIGLSATVVVIVGVFVYLNTGARLADKQAVQGEKYLAGKQYDEAIGVFEKAIKTDKKTAKAYNGLADAYIGLKDTKKAEESVQSGIEASPEADILYLKLAEMYDNDGKPEEAVQTLKTGYAAVKSQNIQTQLKKLQAAINTYGNTSGNIANLGIVAQQGDWIYYTNSDGSNNYSLNKVRTDGTGKTKINDDLAVYINVVGDWIYYTNNDGSNKGSLKGSLNKIRTDGTGKTKINDDLADVYINVVGDWIYCLNNSDDSLYKMHTDGTGKTKINDDLVGQFNVVGDWIYYTSGRDNNFLYKMHTDGTGKTKINDDLVGQFNVVGDWIYYTNYEGSDKGSLNKIRTDGTGKTKINDDLAVYINVAGDWIYYANVNDNDSLYKIRTDATENQQVK